MDKDDKSKMSCDDCEDCKGHYWEKHHWHNRGGHRSGGNALYFFGFLGALYYFLQHAVTFNDYIWGIGKSLVWPALLVFKALTLLHI